MNEKVNFKGSVVLNPVPVVLITSRNSEGKDNVFTVGWVGTVCTRPPMLSISIRPERLSHQFIKESMCFTVNLPSSKLTKAVDYCGVKSGRKVDKIREMGFKMKEGTNINVPYIDDCPVSIECKVTNIIPLGSHDMFIAEVVGSHINKSLIDEKGKIHFEKADLINYCHGEYYKMSNNLLGTFGYSVSRKNVLKVKNTSNSDSNSSNIIKSYVSKTKNDMKKTKNFKNTKKKKLTKTTSN